MLETIAEFAVGGMMGVLGVKIGQLWYRLVDKYGWRGWYLDQ